MLHCHCSVCRKHHGTLFATYVAGPLTTFHWRAGTEKIGTWQSSSRGQAQLLLGVRFEGAERRARCAAGVHARGRARGRARHPAADAPVRGLEVAGHEIHDGLPQHEAYPPEWDAQGWTTPARPMRAGVAAAAAPAAACASSSMAGRFACTHCHCGRCRRARGGAHATNVVYKLEALRYTQGEELLADFDLPGAQFFGTSFCGHCGGAMPRRSLKRGAAVVPIGALDSDPGIHPLAHQFVAFKAPWYDIHDGVPQHPEAAQEMGTFLISL